MGIALATLLSLTSPALADVIPPDCSELAEGASCFTSDDEAGTCDAEGTCVASATSTDGGCSATGTRAAAVGLVIGSLGLLAVGRRS